MTKRYFGFLCIVFLITTGCGDKIPLGGKVTFPDGEPLGVGMIFFAKDGYLARATLNPNGSYDVGSLGQKDGLPAGTYKVYFYGTMVRDENSKSGSEYRSLVAQEYISEKTTPLTVTVPGNKVYNIVVERPPQ